MIESHHFYEAPTESLSSLTSLIREPLGMLEIRCPKCHSPTLKSQSFAPPTASVISFHAIFLLLISIHEIRSLSTLQIRSAPEEPRPPPLVLVSRFFLAWCLRKGVITLFIFIAPLSRGLMYINHVSILPPPPPRGSPSHLTTLRPHVLLTSAKAAGEERALAKRTVIHQIKRAG